MHLDPLDPPDAPEPTPATSPLTPAPGNNPVVGGRYYLRQPLALGGMATVYLADDTVLGRQVAVKVLSRRYADRPEARRRFLREARAAASMQHDNIVQVLDFGEDATGALYLIMEFLKGRDLAQVLREDGPLSPALVRRLAGQAARALAVTHALGIVHRDLKPANLFLLQSREQGERVKILDFSVARLPYAKGEPGRPTLPGVRIGTPHYMSPEQILGHPQDPRTDVYGLGIVLYQLLTGALPFAAQSDEAVMKQHLYARPDPLRSRMAGPVPVDLEHVILQALEKRPEHRFPSMAAFVEALENPEDEAWWPEIEVLAGAVEVQQRSATDAWLEESCRSDS